jgi:hypothetical protein
MHTHDTASNNAGNGVFQVQGAGEMMVGSHQFQGSAYNPFYVNIQGYMYLVQSAQFTFTNYMTVGGQFAAVGDLGCLVVPSPPPVFINPGYVTGKRFSVSLNGVIDANTLGYNFFPGTIDGTQASGGQYNP